METQIINVTWDTDGETMDLPVTVRLSIDIEDDDISDALSDQYGWCVLGWNRVDN